MAVGFWEGRKEGQLLDREALKQIHRDWSVRTRATAELGEILRAWVLRGWLSDAGDGKHRVHAKLWAIAAAFHNRRTAA